MHMLYLVFNEGYSGDVDLPAEAIRLTRQLATLISEGVARLQSALARDQLGPYQAQAAIAALHADALRVEETDWLQIVGWYDELLRLTDTPVVRLNRAVAVGEADGAPAGLAALAEVADDVPRRSAVAAHLHERNGDLSTAAHLYAPRPLATPRVCRNAPTRLVRPHASTSSCAILVRHDLPRHAATPHRTLDRDVVGFPPIRRGRSGRGS